MELVKDKLDLILAHQREEIKSIIRKLNRDVKIIQADNGKIDSKEILNTYLFDFVKVVQNAGWQKELLNKHTPEINEYSIGSFVFREHHPLHPENRFRMGLFPDKRKRSASFISGK